MTGHIAASQVLMALSCAVVLLLGVLHVFHTFVGTGLLPQDPAVLTGMAQDHIGLTRKTTVLRAWVGFNASHGLGLILFALVFGYLALAQPQVLFCSWFLLAVGFAAVASWSVLAKVYWFRVPLIGIALAFVCFVTSVAIWWA